MSGTMTLPAIQAYLSVSSTETRQIVKFESTNLQTKSDISYFSKQAPKLNTVDVFLKDYRSLSIVLDAFGMKANLAQTALLRKLITQDPTSKKSVAQQLANSLYIRFAKAMTQFKPPPFSMASNVAAVVTAIGTNSFEAAKDAQSPGLRNALYFKRSIGSITTLSQIMSDAKLLAVATIATNMPDQFGALDYDKQVKLLSSKINLAQLQNPRYVDTFIKKYLTLNSVAAATNKDQTGALSILTNNGSATNVTSLLMPTSSLATTDNLLSLFA